MTISLIAFWVIVGLVFVAVTESYLSDLQVYRRGYVASIDSLPLNLNLSPAELAGIDAALAETDALQASSPRIKFGGMFSNFTETPTSALALICWLWGRVCLRATHFP